MGKSTDLMLLYKIACYYYQDGLSQEEIAEHERISRSQISRLLDKARALQIVKVSVKMPEILSLAGLREKLRRALLLQDVVIAECDSRDEAARVRAIALTGALYLADALKGAKTVGFGWGQTMYETSLQMPYAREGESTLYVPLVGVSGVSNPAFQINTIIDRVAERRKGQGYFLALPTFRQKLIPMTAVDRRRIDRLKEYWGILDAAVFGLGTIKQSERFMGEEAPTLYQRSVRGSGAEGEIISHFFYQDGSLLKVDDSDYVQLAFDLNELRKVRKTICLAGGPEKANGIIQAARSKFFNCLITDSATARLIEQRLEEGRAKG